MALDIRYGDHDVPPIVVCIIQVNYFDKGTKNICYFTV